MNNIQIFQNEQFGKVRIAMNESNEPLFCLADVAKALGYSRPADAVNQHCKGVVILPTPTNGGVQDIKYGKKKKNRSVSKPNRRFRKMHLKSFLPMPFQLLNVLAWLLN